LSIAGAAVATAQPSWSDRYVGPRARSKVTLLFELGFSFFDTCAKTRQMVN
jgi:hypothetical protein